MLDKCAHVALRLLNLAAMPRPIDFVLPRQKLCERGHVVAHRAIRRHDDRGRPRHHMIARKQGVFLRQGESLMVFRMAGRLDADQREICRLDRFALAQDRIRSVSGSVGGVDGMTGKLARKIMRRAADDFRPRRGF